MISAHQKITDRELAEMSRFSLQTVRNWRWKRKGGPPYIVLGRSIRYDLQEVIKWMNETKITPEIGR